MKLLDKKRGVVKSGLVYPKYTSCYHYEAAIISNGKIVEPARSYIGAGNRCKECGIVLKHTQARNLQKLVDCLNTLPVDEKELAGLYKNIPVSQVTVLGPLSKIENEEILEDKAIPLKNVVRK
jgi:hypothetical protein